MRLRRFHSAGEFLDRAEAFMLTDEARNNLALGVAGSVRDQPDLYAEPAYLAVVENDAGVLVAAAIRTPPRGLILPRMGDLDAVTLIAASVYREYGGLPECSTTGEDGEAFVRAWAEVSGQRARVAMSQRIYALTAVRAPPRPPGGMRAGRVDETDLITGWMRDFEVEAYGRDRGAARSRQMIGRRLANPTPTAGLNVWNDGGETVSMCGFSGPTRHGIRIGPVWTPPGLRRRGYATALVAELSAMLLGTGRRFCFLYTDLANPTSNAIYQRIGYEPVGDAVVHEFEPEGGSDAG